MTMEIRRVRFAATAALLAVATIAAAAPKVRISVFQRNQPWSVSVGPADVGGGPGSDFAAEYESAIDIKYLTITNPTGNWRVDVRKGDTNWDPGIRVYVRRTSDGTGTGIISGGTAYQEITDIDATFFTGSGDRSTINIQFKVSGAYAAAGVPYDAYLSTITYTVTDGL